MATIAITMELGDNSISELSDFMGHAEDVHRKHYRINPKERQIIKISQLLEKATGDYDEDDEDHNDDNEAELKDNTAIMGQCDGSTQNSAAQHCPQSLVKTVQKRKGGKAPRDGRKGKGKQRT